jgi:hypothetical protein
LHADSHADICAELKVGSPADRAIAEYWQPTRRWQFFEVFGPEMQIIRQVATPDLSELSVATLRYPRICCAQICYARNVPWRAWNEGWQALQVIDL